jgi:hypothetical protein
VRLPGLAVGLVVWATAGCFRTTVRSGLPPGDVPAGYDEKWHSTWLLGAVETSGPYALDALCPGGWAELGTHTNLLQGLVTAVSYGIYTPQTVTIVCAAPGAAAPPPRDGYAPLPAPATSSYPPAPVRNTYPPPPPERHEF